MVESRYVESLQQLERARKVIPLGAQTFSKSIKTFPPGIAPLYADRAVGSKIWDVDGHEYVDLMSALAAVNLGYSDRQVNEAIVAQVERGTTISLSHPLETEVAELMVELVPSAEKVRFGKNGSDATTAAIRIARAFTSRDHIVTCGYHGWQDWFIGSMPSRSYGVPQSYADLVHPVPYDDLPALEAELKARPVAAVVLEPMTTSFPSPGYLEAVKTLTHDHGAILIFDEMVTGFRFAKGGAQEYFGVTPDLSAFGKGIANGYPLSAVVGRADLLDVLETAFISGTFGGELLSLTAAKVVLERIRTTDAIEQIAATGKRLNELVSQQIAAAGLSSILSLSGHPAWTFLMWDSSTPDLEALKFLFMQEMSRNGVLMIATHNVTAAHDESDIETVIAAYSATLPIVAKALQQGDARSLLEADISAVGDRVR